MNERLKQLRGKDLLTLKEYAPKDISALLDFAADIKDLQKSGKTFHPLKGKMMAMIFQKPSLRTRVSFETGIYQLGGSSLYLGPADIGLGKRETVEDIAKVLSRQVDLIMARVFEHQIVEDLARYSDVPVINGLSDFTHPCQILADFQTILERGKTFAGLKLAYVGDGNNVANSLVFGGVSLGAQVNIASPEGYQVGEQIQEWAREAGSATNGSLLVTTDVKAAAQDADVLYTDVWASMGQEEEAEKRRMIFQGYQINAGLVSLAKAGAIVLHCLPAHYGEEITKDVVDSQNSAIFDEAENRLHAQKALMAVLAGDG